MAKKKFTKSMLVPGRHVVRLADGLYFLVCDGYLLCATIVEGQAAIGEVIGWSDLAYYNEDLSVNIKYVSPIVEVFEMLPRTNAEGRFSVLFPFNKEFLKSVWRDKELLSSRLI